SLRLPGKRVKCLCSAFRVSCSSFEYRRPGVVRWWSGEMANSLPHHSTTSPPHYVTHSSSPPLPPATSLLTPPLPLPPLVHLLHWRNPRESGKAATLRAVITRPPLPARRERVTLAASVVCFSRSNS